MLAKKILPGALLALVLVLAGCNEPPKPPTFVLWEIKYVYAGGRSFQKPTSTSTRQIEGSLDRVACELIQTKHQQSEEAFQALLPKQGREMIRLGMDVPARDWTSSVYRCLKTGVEPETAPS